MVKLHYITFPWIQRRIDFMIVRHTSHLEQGLMCYWPEQCF